MCVSESKMKILIPVMKFALAEGVFILDIYSHDSTYIQKWTLQKKNNQNVFHYGFM